MKLRAWALAAAVTAAAPTFAIGTAAVALFDSAAAEARPGGGSSFSGGSRSGGGSFHSTPHSYSGGGSYSSHDYGYGGGGGGIDLFAWFLAGGGGPGFLGTIFILLIVGYIATRRLQSFNLTLGAPEGPPVPRSGGVRRTLERLRQSDPNFSLVLLDDFLYALYAEAHTRRPAGGLERLSGYLRPGARSALAGLSPEGSVAEVRSIIVGAMRFTDVGGLDPSSDGVRLSVEYEANYTEVAPNGHERSYYAAERWTLYRKWGVASRTPDRVRVFSCPSCGAPLDATIGGRCSYCQNATDSGRFDWVVEQISIGGREERGPMLTGTTEEQGTDLPTVSDPDARQRFAALTQRDPSVTWQALQPRVQLIFDQMQTSWSSRDWTKVRPFVSDNLFQSLGYWIDAYRRQHLRNVTENARILDAVLARVTSDQFFDAITIRIFATSLDYTIRDEDGKVVGGSRSHERRYTEYWTLIRGSQRKGPPRADLACPNCGAPLEDIEMAGTCRYCRARVTAGDFDWVLSRIEQDDVYEG